MSYLRAMQRRLWRLRKICLLERQLETPFIATLDNEVGKSMLYIKI